MRWPRTDSGPSGPPHLGRVNFRHRSGSSAHVENKLVDFCLPQSDAATPEPGKTIAKTLRDDYIKPGAPWENAYVESFRAQVGLKQLDRELLFNLREVNAANSNYAYEYNFHRPHGGLGKRPPAIAAQRELPLRPTACAPVRAGNVPMNN